ncbi:tungstate ABC transporter substrate-binding protein WtpA [bacterium]
MKIFKLSLVFMMLFSSVVFAKQEKKNLIIFHAGSLAIPFAQMEKEFEKKYPEIDVKREASGSRTAARKISDLKRDCDVMASADYSVIETLLIPAYADFNISFAVNEMAIMYTEHSKYHNEINANNWYEILLKPDVEYGHSDPNVDPCGYRAMLVWQLAEKHYKVNNLYNKLTDARPKKNIRPKETDLIALLESGELDYLFIYKSVASQHKELYLELPVEISLRDNVYNDFYKQAKVEITGKTPGTFTTKKGQAMVYGITIPKTASNYEYALKFVDFVLSKKGRKVMTENGQGVIVPAKSDQKNGVPKKLQKYVK